MTQYSQKIFIGHLTFRPDTSNPLNQQHRAIRTINFCEFEAFRNPWTIHRHNDVARSQMECFRFLNFFVWPAGHITPVQPTWENVSPTTKLDAFIRANIFLAAKWIASYQFSNHVQLSLRPFGIFSARVPKHIEEEGLGEAVEQGQGGAALGSEGFGLVEDGGDAALFFPRGQQYFDPISIFTIQPRNSSSPVHLIQTSTA